ncbi:L,D-transpeptidase family protein [Rhizomonospora bruguierae]|uniref:L,D-transpeptidase family protein n=1 Tax=Rhizomonospora bruguierae TaxID=1581705 RepID=UPI001BD00AFA|nr:L,D-transpeptidase family protein [Micromonospora sp. NBRC 107566]
MRRRTLLVGAAAGAAAPLFTGAPARADLTVPPRLVGSIAPVRRPVLPSLPPTTTQVVVVHGPGGTSTSATVETFARTGTGHWGPVFAPLPARIGRSGFKEPRSRVEGDGSTPTGVYAFGPTMYGIAANPGVAFGYHRLVENDWWNENPASPGYNSFRHGSNPGGGSEALWTISPQYTHFAVITYNMAPTVPTPVPGKGSGIFLHRSGTSPGPTAGCVSLAHDHLVGVLRWLDPAGQPRIVLSPTDDLGRY